MSKILIIDTDGVGLSFAWRCVQAGHEVKFFLANKPDINKEIGDGFKGISKVDNWVSHILWADLVVPTSNDMYVDRLDFFRKKGVKIFGPNPETAKLEINRKSGMEILEKCGIECVPYKNFKSMGEAVKHIEKTGERFVFKTLGDNEDKALTYVSKNAADLLEWVDRIIRLKKEPQGEVMLQTFIPGIEMAVGRFMGSKGFVGPWNENFEHKKLMSGNYGPNTGEMGTIAAFTNTSKLGEETLAKCEKELVKLGHIGATDVGFIIDDKGKPWPTEWTCYDDSTEVLTQSGWKLFKEVNKGESIATLDPVTNMLEYRPAVDVIEKDHDGEMIHFHGDRSAPDLMVTTDHSMWVMDGNTNQWSFQSAERVARAGNWKIKRSASWGGTEEHVFILPGYTEIHQMNQGGRVVEIDHHAIHIRMDDWLKFLGLYISEGSMGRKCDKGIGYIVNIAQQGPRLAHVQEALSSLPLTCTKQKRGFQISSRQLCRYLHAVDLGLSHKKHIPKEFMNLSSRQLNILLDHLIMGDGSTHKRNGQRTYYTTSPKLAGQVQELILKTGGLGRTVLCPAKGTTMSVGNGEQYIRNHDMYMVSERKVLIDGWVDKRLAHRVDYKGKVYCLNVPPHHLLYVKRNGNPSWCGNCRPGWPIFNMMLGSIEGDPATWMIDALNGKDTTSFKEDIGCCLVLAHGDFPHSNATKKETTGIPIYGVTKGNKKHLHPQAVRIDVMRDMDGDKVVKRPLWNTAGDYVMVVTGYGKDVKQSAERAYKTVKQLHISNMIVRDDIGEGMKNQLPELHTMGYAKHFEYEKEKDK